MIIVDDFSNEETKDILKKFSKKNKIKIYWSNKNRGAGYSRNYAIKKSNSPYLAFIDSDDVWKKNKLKQQINFMKKNTISKVGNLFETMERIGMPLLIHGEVTDFNVDVFDREAVFIERHLEPLLRTYSSLKVVLEHITTIDAIDFVENSEFDIAATITPHHLHINRNAMFNGGLRSDFYCLPTAKREIHRIALRQAATSGKTCFFLGTDSAPHTGCLTH